MSEPKIAELVMFISRLVQEIRKHDLDNATAWQAMNYLKNKDCTPAVFQDMLPTVSENDAANVLAWVEDDDEFWDEEELADDNPAYDYDRGDGFFSEYSE